MVSSVATSLHQHEECTIFTYVQLPIQKDSKHRIAVAEIVALFACSGDWYRVLPALAEELPTRSTDKYRSRTVSQ